MYKRKRIRNVSVDEMNEMLAYADKYWGIYFRQQEEGETLKGRAFIVEHQTRLELTMYYHGDATTFVCRLDGRQDPNSNLTGSLAYATAQKYYKVPKIEGDLKFSAKPLLWFNKKYQYQRLHAYYYDLNSAYATVLVNKIPDTTKAKYDTVVGKNEVGFLITGDMVHEGRLATWVFPLIDSPLKRFVEHWYDKKKNAKTPEDKFKAKNMLTYYVGYLQYVNPFLRSYIVQSCNELIESLMDDNTIICNTDCIVSTVPRNELTIGPELGQWKYEEGEIACIGHNYQWNNEIKYRGVPKGWFPDGYDILRDKIPSFGNLYEFSKEQMIIKEIEHEKNA